MTDQAMFYILADGVPGQFRKRLPNGLPRDLTERPEEAEQWTQHDVAVLSQRKLMANDTAEAVS